MDTIPENTQDTKEEILHKKHRILRTIMRIIFTIIRVIFFIIRKIFVVIFKIFIFETFLFLLAIRGMVIRLLSVIAGGSALVFIVFSIGVYLGGEMPHKLHIPILIITPFICFGSLTAMWYYDALLFHLTPAGYEIRLFQ